MKTLKSKVLDKLNRKETGKLIKIKIDDVMYKVISQRKIKNKTSFFLEVDND